MERFFILNNKNTWYDWRLILTGKDISDAEPKTNYIELDGKDGSLDLSESLTGEVTYSDRSISMSFWTDNGSRTDRERLFKEITAFLHGRKVKIIEPDDLDHYFIGRIKVKDRKNIIPYGEISLEATCEPWRYSINDSSRTVVVNGDSVEAIIGNNGVKTLCPDIVVDGLVTITYDGYKRTLSTGSYKISDIRLKRGGNLIKVSGSGSITFTYKEADL